MGLAYTLLVITGLVQVFPSPIFHDRSVNPKTAGGRKLLETAGGGPSRPPPLGSQLVEVRFSKSRALWFCKIQKKIHAKFY